MKQRIAVFAVALALALPAFAQSENNSSESIANAGQTPPVYRVRVVERTTKAIDYRHKGKAEFRMIGTDLMPQAYGEAKVKPEAAHMKIDIDFKKLEPPQMFGPQYLTYVLWALTPEGRPVNLGEIALENKKDEDFDMHTTTNLQAFGMIVTAEPYFAVTRPSDVVVMENAVDTNLKADVEPINARYEALDRNEYSVDINPSDLPSATAASNVPRDLVQAENAVAIAKASGAERYAGSTIQSAQTLLNEAQNGFRLRADKNEIITAARQAAQRAEDARVIAVRTRQQEQRAAEREAALRREQEAAQRAQQAQLEAQRMDEQRRQAEADRQAALQARAESDQAAQKAAAERQLAEQARQEALQQQQNLQLQAQQAQLQAQQAEQARQQAEAQAQQTRQRLMSQLNSVLQTRETARGLIVNMSDVLFDTGKATLKPGARVRLAKVAGIVMAYPDLKLDVGGYTDSTGSESFNEQLSEERASTVRSFLVSQGVPATNVTAQGHGESDPIATNNTAAGRQLNRRVELLVSGESIGTGASASNTSVTPSPAPQQPGAIGTSANPQ